MTSDRTEEVNQILARILEDVISKFSVSSHELTSETCLVSVNYSSEGLRWSAWILQTETEEFMSELRLEIALAGISDDVSLKFPVGERFGWMFREIELEACR